MSEYIPYVQTLHLHRDCSVEHLNFLNVLRLPLDRHHTYRRMSHRDGNTPTMTWGIGDVCGSQIHTRAQISGWCRISEWHAVKPDNMCAVSFPPTLMQLEICRVRQYCFRWSKLPIGELWRISPPHCAYLPHNLEYISHVQQRKLFRRKYELCASVHE